MNNININWPVLFNSKRFQTALTTFVVTIIVIAIPELEPYEETLTEMLFTLGITLIGGYSLQDAVVAWKAGTTKYDQ